GQDSNLRPSGYEPVFYLCCWLLVFAIALRCLGLSKSVFALVWCSLVIVGVGLLHICYHATQKFAYLARVITLHQFLMDLCRISNYCAA
ncbi:MAG: hypothetical protein K8F24_08700, partial [Bacteroidales bacterium]|nr:hypothetical protein [Bacteroidales bacterium]